MAVLLRPDGALELRENHVDHRVKIDPMESVPRVMRALGRVTMPVIEGQLVAYVGWLEMEREAGRRSVSAASLALYL
jgi:hypothetical protein